MALKTGRLFSMILSCHHICKSFGDDTVLKDISFGIEEYEKTAIVGINGAGKSTLLKIIVGEMQADEGEVILAKGKTFGYLAQQKMLSGHKTIWEELREAKQDLFDLEEKIGELSARMQNLTGSDLSDAMEQYHRMQTRFEQENGYAVESEMTGVLKGLGFTEDEFHKNTDTLSGGQKTRVALGKLLLLSPDIIMLDEPTNHLDMNSIAWLETYLRSYKGAVIIVAHDRYFLNRVVTKVVELDHGTSTVFQGNYSMYAEKKKMLRDAQMKAYLNQQAQIKHQEEVIEKLKSFNREKSIRRAESREKMLAKMDVLEKPQDDNSRIRITLSPQTESGNDVLHAENLSKGFDGVTLFSDLSFDIYRGERVAIIGDNGTGKTTLLKVLNSLLAPDQGFFRLGAKTSIGYYDQEHQVLHPEKTLFEEISDSYPALDNTRIRNVLASFLFTGDDVFKRIRDLSGGERGRVSLAKLMLSNANFLILDEPTNHLDIFSKEILEEALTGYTGTVLYVSHDRYFINQTATRILDLTNHMLVNYIGNYDYYIEKKEELTAAALADRERNGIKISDAGSEKNGSDNGEAAASGGEQKQETVQLSWQEQKARQAALRKRQNDLKKTESRIAELEARDSEIDTLLTQEEIFTDLEAVTRLSAEKADIAADLETLYEAWETLAE